MRNLYLRLLGLLQGWCKHPPETVSVDILEGMFEGYPVAQCRICGAIRFFNRGTWRETHAEWWINEGRQSGVARHEEKP